MTRVPLKRLPTKPGGLAQHLQPEIKRHPRKTLIYGHGGIGKSTFASRFPRPVFWVTDPGLGTLRCNKLPKATTLEEFAKWQSVLESNLNDFDTLVLDSLGTLEQLIWNHVCKNYETKTGKIETVKHIGDPAYGAGYQQALRYWNPIFNFLDKMNEKHKKEIILIAHARADTSVNTETMDSLKMMPAVHKYVQTRLDQWCDEIFYAYMTTFTRMETHGDKVKVKGTKSDGERMMGCVGCGAWMAKNRFDLPLEIEFSYDVYNKYVNQFYESKGK